MPAPPQGILGHNQWVGSSKEKPVTIESATLDAYNLARKSHPKGKLALQIITVYAIGDNPITEYRAKVGLA